MSSIKLQTLLFKLLALVCIVSCTVIFLSGLTRLVKTICYTYDAIDGMHVRNEINNHNFENMISGLNDIEIELEKAETADIDKIQNIIGELKSNPLWEDQEFREVQECMQSLENMPLGEWPAERWDFSRNNLHEATEIMLSLQAEELARQSQEITGVISQQKSTLKYTAISFLLYICTMLVVCVAAIKTRHIIYKNFRKAGE